MSNQPIVIPNLSSLRFVFLFCAIVVAIFGVFQHTLLGTNDIQKVFAILMFISLALVF